jgi:hypothetical protein
MSIVRTRILALAVVSVSCAGMWLAPSPTSASPAVPLPCTARQSPAVNGAYAYYNLSVVNTTNAAVPAGTLMQWPMAQPAPHTGSVSGGQYLPYALPPHGSETLIKVEIPILATLPPTTCSIAIAATYSAPGYGSGNAGPSSPKSLKPVVHAQ